VTPPAAGHRIVILCEGDTEVIAVKNFLGPQLDRDGLKSVGLQPINLKAKFGDISIKTVGSTKDARVVAVFTLIDLYGLGGPPYPKAASVAQKHSIARDWLQGQVPLLDAGFFHPHFAVHDIEAWLLAEGTALSSRLQHKLKPEPKAESIDFDQPPSKRVNTLFLQHRKHAYRKKLDAPTLFKQVSFEAVYTTCPYFKVFYDDLANVARGIS